jgi:hypothetical protein
MYLAEIDIFGIVVIALSIVIVVIIALVYEKQMRKVKELKRQRSMLTARLNKLVGGRKKARLSRPISNFAPKPAMSKSSQKLKMPD